MQLLVPPVSLSFQPEQSLLCSPLLWREIKEAESESDISGWCPALIMKEPVDLESLLTPSANVDDCSSFPHKHANTRWPSMNSPLIPLWSMPHTLVVIVHLSAISLVIVVGSPES